MVRDSLDNDSLLAERAAHVSVCVWVVDDLVAELIYHLASLASLEVGVALVVDEHRATRWATPPVGVYAFL